MTKTKKIAVALVLSLIMAFTARGTLAYFSSYRTTNGEAQMSLLPSAALSEELGESKVISVENTGNTTIVVKIKAFLPTVDGVTFQIGDDAVSGKIERQFVVEPGASTDKIKIDVVKEADLAPKFEIPVVYEYAPALYDSQGNIDWALINSTFFNRG
ncbi:MAG: hypothetical protein PUB11_03640 [Oscillospiraceae bacterium]|nr:hypothetical protein [Oscillospiraceae bacterium]